MIITRTTRNKKATTTSNSEKDVKTFTKKTAKSKNEKLNANKGLKQNENVVPFTENTKDFPLKNSQSKTILGSKLRSTRKNNSLTPKTAALSMKSPVLRDRTNTTNELAKAEFSSTKINEKSSNKNMKSVKRRVVKKVVTKKENKVPNKLLVSIKKFVVEERKTQKENVSKALDDRPMSEEHVTKVTTRHTNSKTTCNLSKEKKVVKDIDSNSAKNEKEIAESVLDKTSDSHNLNLPKRRVLRSINISTDDIEKLLNEDEEAIENKPSNKVSNNNEPNVKEKNNEEQNKLCNSKTEIPNQESAKQNEKKSKKFFKLKGSAEEIKRISAAKKNPRRPMNNRKKGGAKKKSQNNDSTFNLSLEEERKSMKIPEKQLRPRANKNYCEVSKLSETSTEKKEEVKENSNPNKDHNMPIYKTVILSQEKVKDKEEIYDFPDDSQETEKKNKKRKKIVRRPANKGAKKAIQKVQKNPANRKVPLKVQFKVQDVEPTNIENEKIVNNFSVNITVPEYVHDAGDSTIGEASTIKILSNEKLEGSKKIDLTTTPPIPKTITSQLKLYGPKNVITSQPTTKYSNMVNHSLVRKDMSPITKLGDDFDMGSPWRSVDAFSRVKQLVHSTPQINRLPLMREKIIPKVLSKNESIFSEDTIHLSYMNNNKLSNTEETLKTASLVKKTDASPRKFGNMISNLSPEQHNTSQTENNETRIENNRHSMQAVSPLLTSPVLPVAQEKISLNPVIQNKENIIPSPKKSPKKKYSSPSPFRFERLRTINRISTKPSQSKVPKSIAQKEDEKLEPEAGPSWLENPRPTNLKQSNLNNFLNLDEMPESTRISTAHGIFDDAPSTPINNKKYKKVIEEANIENAFGFDDCDSSEISPVINHASTPIFATEEDVRSSVKGKLFPKARVKSSVPSRISLNTVKQTLKNVLKKEKENKNVIESSKEKDENIAKEKSEKINIDVENNNEPKKAMLDAVSFSDTFDVISNEEVLSKVSDNIPLFVDLEPVHFSKPPRRSYNKRKRVVYFDTKKDDFEDDDEEYEQPKSKKKKESKLSREEHKRMQEWVKSINNTFEEIEDFDLVVE